MRRREFIASIAVASLPVAVGAQQLGRTYRLGYLTYLRGRTSTLEAVLESLRAADFVEGTNLELDERGFGLRSDQFASAALQMAQSRVDVFVCASGGPSVRGAQAAGTAFPIVAIADDMVKEGIVDSLAGQPCPSLSEKDKIDRWT